jgi:hypothetical protein
VAGRGNPCLYATAAMDRFVPRGDGRAAVTPHPVIARRAAPWQSMPSRDGRMDRFVPRGDGWGCGNGGVEATPTPRHCEARRAVAIHVFVRRPQWIASFLAMTAGVR